MRTLNPLLSYLLAASVTASGLAAETAVTTAADTVSLDPFEVLGEREPGDLNMDAAQIERLQAVDLSDLFSNQSTIAVGGGSAVAQKIYVRGFEDTMLNVTVDGAQQIGELYHHQARLQLEPEFIKTISLDAGAGAATNGAGALTGAMRVTLKDAFDLLQGDRDWGTTLKATYGFNGEDSHKFVGAVYGKLSDNVGLVLNYTEGEGDDYADGNGDIVTPTGYNHQRGYVKLNGTQHGHEWSLAYEQLHDFGTYYERPHMTNFTGAFVLSDHEMNRRTFTANHHFDNGDGLLNLESTFYWTDSDFENVRTTTDLIYGQGNLESIGFDVRNHFAFAGHELTAGLDFRHDESFGLQQATPPPYWGSSDQTASITGLFAQDDWRINEVVTATAGVRFDAYDHQVESGVGAGATNDGEGFSPNVGLTWQITSDLSVRASYARAFRGVTIRETFFNGLYLHDGTLEPEVADNVELGFNWERDGLFLRGTVYEQNIEDFIGANYLGSGGVWGVWANLGDAKVEGYEFEAGKAWSRAFLSVGVWDAQNTLDEAALTDADLGLGTTIGRTWTAKAKYFIPAAHLDLGFSVRHVEAEANAIAATAPAKPSYTTADLFASWQPMGSDRFTVSAAVRNVFDEFYYDHATYFWVARGGGAYPGFPAKGREISLSLSFKY